MCKWWMTHDVKMWRGSLLIKFNLSKLVNCCCKNPWTWTVYGNLYCSFTISPTLKCWALWAEWPKSASLVTSLLPALLTLDQITGSSRTIWSLELQNHIRLNLSTRMTGSTPPRSPQAYLLIPAEWQLPPLGVCVLCRLRTSCNSGGLLSFKKCRSATTPQVQRRAWE